MKKSLKNIAILLCTLTLFFVISCNAKAPTSPSTTGKTGTTGTSINTAQPKITYTKEFSYLPSYNNMALQSYNQPGKNKMGTAKYLLQNTTTEKVLNDYGDLLKRDGWTVYYSRYKDNNKPYSIAAQKNQHQAVVLAQQVGDNVTLSVTSL